MKLGYWDIRGLGQPIRYILAYKEVDVEEKRYACGPPPEFDGSQWFSEKFNLDLDFPNLPYLIDGDVRLTHHITIMRYLGRKFDLVGSTCEEIRRVELAEQQLVDFRAGWVRLTYSSKFEEEKGAYHAAMIKHLDAFSKFLGDRPYFAGDKLTYVDFLVYDVVGQHNVFYPNLSKEYPKLAEFLARIEALPTMKAYLASDKFIKYPFNGDMAHYGGRLNPSPF